MSNLRNQLNEEQQNAFQKYLDGDSFLLTGGAGTGKSHVLKSIITDLNKRIDQDQENIEYAVTAMTGVSSVSINGTTLHSWAGIGLGDKDLMTTLSRIRRSGKDQNWRNTHVLIIDEISMMDARLFEMLHCIGCILRNPNHIQWSTSDYKKAELFGGLQLILAGDFLQLPPPSGSSKMAFNSFIWKNKLKDHVIYLRKIIRQRNAVFQAMLNRIRLGKIQENDKKILNQRLMAITGPPERNGVQPTKLFSLRKNVEEINEREFEKLIRAGNTKHDFYPELEFRWHPITSPHRAVSLFQLETNKREAKKYFNRIANDCRNNAKNAKSNRNKYDKNRIDYQSYKKFCVGTQVMLNVNLDPHRKLVNGSRGVIIGFDNQLNPIVRFDHGLVETITRHKFEINHGNYSILFYHYPLVFAWSMTIHKAQSATLSLVITDLNDVFCPGQTYVCLSRVQSLEGLYLLGINYSKIRAHPEAIKFYKEMGYECQLQYLDECQIDPWVCTIGKKPNHPETCSSCLILYLHQLLGGRKMPILVAEMVVNNL